MCKKEQQKINELVESEWDKAEKLYMQRWDEGYDFVGEQLYYCQAKVYKYDNYIILQSYETIVALINTESKIFVDALRLEYVYTATSAQHIAKFRKKYTNYFDKIYTWRDI